MCNCDECREKREDQITSTRATGYILLALGIMGGIRADLTLPLWLAMAQSIFTLFALVIGAIILAMPSKKIINYLGKKEVEHAKKG